MVYCGKPSRGCQMCRTRRIKCDETKPKCNQCAKSRRECPGYKDEFDLVFRNETQATERRARKANKKAIAKMNKDVIEPAQQQPVPAFTAYDSTVAVPNPRVPLDQQAECHFVANWVLLPRQQGGTRGFMEHLVPLLKTQSHCYHFRLAFDACALASLNNRVGTGHDFEKESLGLYTKALSSTFAALKDPVQSTADTTLAAILLLGLYENITARQMGMLAWGSHIEGAIQLVKARGRDILRTQTGRWLFIAVRTQMIIHTLSTGTPPIMGVEWWITDAVQDTHAAQCQKLNIRVGELRAEVNRLMTTVGRSSEEIELMLDMIRKCQIVDQEFVAWADDLPEVFRWHTVTWEDRVPGGDYSKADVYPGRVDIYQDLWVVSVINMQRCSRLILASLIVRCAAWVCSPVDYRTTPEYATAARTCHEIITDIIASVPYQLGYFHKRKDLHARIALSGFACGDEDTIKGLPGYFLSWPLVCIYGQDYISDTQRTWIRGRLEFIGNHVGVRYAHILKQINVRIPSMLIRRDGLMANPYPTGHNFEKLLSARNAKPTPGYAMNPLQQREAMQKAHVEKQKNELLSKVVGKGQLDEWTAKTWLVLNPGQITAPST